MTTPRWSGSLTLATQSISVAAYRTSSRSVPTEKRHLCVLPVFLRDGFEYPVMLQKRKDTRFSTGKIVWVPQLQSRL